MITKSILVLLLLAGSAVAQEIPIVNVPYGLRQENWGGVEGGGSCVHVSMVTLLRWQGQPELAKWWYNTYNSGEYASRMAERLNAAGVYFAEVRNGDERFLDWAIKTRRGANIVVMDGRHMLTLVHLDAKYAGILDNNDISKISWYHRADLIRVWKDSGGWAVTPYYTPAPPPLKK